MKEKLTRAQVKLSAALQFLLRSPHLYRSLVVVEFPRNPNAQHVGEEQLGLGCCGASIGAPVCREQCGGCVHALIDEGPRTDATSCIQFLDASRIWPICLPILGTESVRCISEKVHTLTSQIRKDGKDGSIGELKRLQISGLMLGRIIRSTRPCGKTGSIGDGGFILYSHSIYSNHFYKRGAC